MRSKRGSYIDRAFRVVQLFNTGQIVTAGLIQQRLGIGERMSYRWLEAASLELPIYEVGRVDNGKRAGVKPVGYKLLK